MEGERREKAGVTQSPGHPSLSVGWAGLLLNVPHTCLSARFMGEISSREAGLSAEGRERGPKPTSRPLYPGVPHPRATCASVPKWTQQGGGGEFSLGQ